MEQQDSLKVTENEDGSFTLEWDKDDPKWAFLNKLSDEEIQEYVQEAIEHFILNNTSVEQ